MKRWRTVDKVIKLLLGNRRVVLPLVALAILGFFIWQKQESPETQIKTSPAQRTTLIKTITATGRTESQKEAALGFLTSGTLVWIGVTEGDLVKAGQPVARLDSSQLEKELKKLLNLYLKERLDLEDVRDSQENKIITDELKRISQRAQVDLDNTVLDVEIKDLAIKLATLTSPISGVVTRVNYPTASVAVLPTDKILTIADPNQLYFVAEVDESDIAQVDVGQKAVLTLNAFPDRQIDQRISQIAYQAATTEGGATVFEVGTKLYPPSDQALKIGMNGDLVITTASKKNALVVPKEAVQEGDIIWLKRGQRYEMVAVKLGLASGLEIQITEGLAEGDEVVTAGFDLLGAKNPFSFLPFI